MRALDTVGYTEKFIRANMDAGWDIPALCCNPLLSFETVHMLLGRLSEAGRRSLFSSFAFCSNRNVPLGFFMGNPEYDWDYFAISSNFSREVRARFPFFPWRNVKEYIDSDEEPSWKWEDVCKSGHFNTEEILKMGKQKKQRLNGRWMRKYLALVPWIRVDSGEPFNARALSRNKFEYNSRVLLSVLESHTNDIGTPIGACY
jgi:hypothetical protein